MKKDVNYHIWNDEPIQADYYTNVEFPQGGSIYTSIGKVTIEKGDAVYLDYGRSLIQYTMSGKGPQAEFPYGKVQLHGVPASVVLNESKNTMFVKSTQEEFDTLMKIQNDRVNQVVPQLKEAYLKQHIERVNKTKQMQEQAEASRKKNLANALGQMESFFKPKS